MHKGRYKGTGRDSDADTGGRWFESLKCIIVKEVGKRIVVDRQNIIHTVRVQEVQSGRQTRGQGDQHGQAVGFRVKAGNGQNRED
jgi:hypothetical protein